MIAVSIARERSEEGRDCVTIALRDQKNGTKATVQIRFRGAAALAASLFAASAPDGDGWESDFILTGEITP